MNQKYSSGLGNYLRAEILGRIPTLNPFETAKYAFQNHPELFDLCREIPILAYMKGGGELKSWVNPINESKVKEKLIQFYQNRERCIPIKDRNKRVFWCDKKWLELIPERYKNK